MIVVMKPQATSEQIQTVVQRVREMGLKEQVIEGTELSVVAVIGDDRKKDRNVFETMPGVDKIVPILAPYKRSSIEIRRQRTQVRISDRCVIGGTQVQVIAGPCSVESEKQILAAARGIAAAGATALRGGAFKPRTNPYSFQGLGEQGLKLLAMAREQTGLAVITEVLSPGDVELVARYADCLQIGARNAQNFELLKAVGQQPKPVLYKRGMAMTVEEYLLAAEYILDAGNENVILCERGIRTFEDHVRNTLSLATIAEVHKRSHLPIIADPSHGTGHAHLVAPMSYASVAAGADAVIIEVHPDPAHALTDGGQSLTPAQLNEMMPVMRKVAEAIGRTLCG
ncbi:MAG: 3-deoxy-7-phosphoheptulonate synthase [Phycisphaerales bacterium]